MSHSGVSIRSRPRSYLTGVYYEGDVYRIRLSYWKNVCLSKVKSSGYYRFLCFFFQKVPLVVGGQENPWFHLGAKRRHGWMQSGEMPEAIAGPFDFTLVNFVFSFAHPMWYFNSIARFNVGIHLWMNCGRVGKKNRHTTPFSRDFTGFLLSFVCLRARVFLGPVFSIEFIHFHPLLPTGLPFVDWTCVRASCWVNWPLGAHLNRQEVVYRRWHQPIKPRQQQSQPRPL